MLLNSDLKASIKELVLTHENHDSEEICGVIDKKKIPTLKENKAVNKADCFTLDMPENSDILAIFHTHWKSTHNNKLTFADIQIARVKKIPVLMYHVFYDTWDYYDPRYPHPYPLDVLDTELTPKDLNWYEGHIYSYGRSDCYSIIKDWYRGYLGIDVEDADRYESDFLNHNHPAWNRFLEELTTKGKWQLKSGKISQHDLILFRVNSSNPNHCGVIVELLEDDAKLLHQYGGRRTSEIISLNSIKRSAFGIYSYPR